MANTLWEKIEAKFTELKAQLTPAAPAASADNAKTISDFRSQLDGIKVELDAKDAEITQLSASNAKLETDLKASQDAQKDFDAKVEAAASKKAQEITASVGVPPLKAPASTTQADNTKTRAEFNAMSPADQSKFCLSGGKLTN